jgi:hypothetical protein
LTTYGLRAWIGEASASRAATAANTTVAKICIMNIGLESRWQTHPVASSSLDSYLSFSEAHYYPEARWYLGVLQGLLPHVEG